MRQPLRRLCTAAFLGAMMAVTAVPALAHPKLVKAQPAKGAVLMKAPTRIQLWFHEELDTKQSSFSVVSQKNERVDTGDAKVNLDDRTRLDGSLKALGPGIYTVQWRAVADDDKGVTEGTFTFRVQK